MCFRIVLLVVLSVLGMTACQQPLDDLSEISPYLPPDTVEKKLLQQCESFAQNLSEENERLKNEVDILRLKIETMEDVDEEEDEDEEEDDGKDESHGNSQTENGGQ
ncbi:hypothetical protein RUM43_010790 [Polyplax serrata]|uniref:Uncharacterized protein n=1 Tax=Polyplax serrata TaxID=468196 RepID=A0AAN8PKZ9_POLSC